MTTLLVMDGVLRHVNGTPIHEGIILYHALCEYRALVLALDSPERESDAWLRVHGLDMHDRFITADVAYGDDDLRARQIDDVRSRGRLALLVEPDPTRAAAAVRQGVTTLLFAHPKFSRPEFSPDARPLRRWDAIEAELDRQQKIVPPLPQE